MGGRWWQMVLAAAVAIINLCVKFCILNSAFAHGENLLVGDRTYIHALCNMALPIGVAPTSQFCPFYAGGVVIK